MMLTGHAPALSVAAQLDSILEFSRDALIRVSLDGLILGWSASAERLYGYAAEEAEGRHISLLEPLDCLDELAKLLESAARGESVVFYETVHIQKSGRRLSVAVSLAPIRETSGGVGAVFLVVRDSSGTRRLEEQLRQAQKMDAVGKLATGVAHDFNNLLTVIQGYGQMLLDDLDPSHSARAHLDEILRAAHRAAGLARQLLTFSRRQPVQVQVVDLNQSVIGLENMLRRLLTENIELRTALRIGAVRIKADPCQVEQVIVNLVVNACDAMPHGGAITIETGLLDQAPAAAACVISGPCAVLTVSDTGSGMDSDTQMRLFEPFFTTKEEGKGTGVGLSMVYDIVTRSGGYITVESEPDRGARFRLYFPRAAEASAAADDTPAVEPSRGDETVLIAEDDTNVRRLVERILRRQGYAVLEADGGREAIEICSRYQGDIALLVTDVVMKDMSGHELYESLAPFRAGMRVLYMSGYPDHAIAHHGVRGEAPFIGKPFTPEALASKVREVLDRSTCVRAAQRSFGFREFRRGREAKARTMVH